MSEGTPDLDTEALAIAMLTLRVNTPGGKWLGAADDDLFSQMWREAAATENGLEELVLSMMNLAWYALINLAVWTGKDEGTLLAQIVQDNLPQDGGGS